MIVIGYEYRLTHSNNNANDDKDIDRPSFSKRKRRKSHQWMILSWHGMMGQPKSPGLQGMIRLEKRVVVEIKRFAGQEIRIESRYRACHVGGH